MITIGFTTFLTQNKSGSADLFFLRGKSSCFITPVKIRNNDSDDISTIKIVQENSVYQKIKFLENYEISFGISFTKKTDEVFQRRNCTELLYIRLE